MTPAEGSDPVEGPVDTTVPARQPIAVNDDFIDTSFSTETLLEEPITSGSDPGLWECDPADGQCGPNDGSR